MLYGKDFNDGGKKFNHIIKDRFESTTSYFTDEDDNINHDL